MRGNENRKSSQEIAAVKIQMCWRKTYLGHGLLRAATPGFPALSSVM